LIRHQCPACDLIFGADKMFGLSSAELSQDYEWHYSMYEEGDSTGQEVRAFHCLNPVREGVYLNYGAGSWSRSVQQLRDDGWNIVAYEPHRSASSGEGSVISSRESLLSMKFDGIFSNNLLEHLRTPVDEVKFMSTLLKPGGRMAHATPCFDYLYEYTRFHLFFFLGRSRNLLASKAGMVVDNMICDGEFICCVMSKDIL
jgi:SAM-dependent methyltransferase